MKSFDFSAQDSGVYRAPVGAGKLCAEADRAGLIGSEIDLRNVSDKRALLDTFERALQFPESFGGNWDALSDCLQDLSWLPPGKGRVLLLNNVAGLAAAAPDSYDMLLDVLVAAAEGWKRRGRVFIVWVDVPTGLPEFPAQ